MIELINSGWFWACVYCAMMWYSMLSINRWRKLVEQYKEIVDGYKELVVDLKRQIAVLEAIQRGGSGV